VGSIVLLLGWFAWLGSTALTKSREPVVSRAQAAAAPVAVVKQSFTPASPEPGTVIVVKNLPACTGFHGPGEYLLLLQPLGLEDFVVVGQQNSPGARLEGVGAPKIYAWGPAVHAQELRLFPPPR
jgi:hypothetical protein